MDAKGSTPRRLPPIDDLRFVQFRVLVSKTMVEQNLRCLKSARVAVLMESINLFEVRFACGFRGTFLVLTVNRCQLGTGKLKSWGGQNGEIFSRPRDSASCTTGLWAGDERVDHPIAKAQALPDYDGSADGKQPVRDGL